jgi:hypothetical protein
MLRGHKKKGGGNERGGSRTVGGAVADAEVGWSKAVVHRIWQKYGLQPHRVETFKFSRDPEFDRKLADIVGLYLESPERALVLCVDE